MPMPELADPAKYDVTDASGQHDSQRESDGLPEQNQPILLMFMPGQLCLSVRPRSEGKTQGTPGASQISGSAGRCVNRPLIEGRGRVTKP